MKKFLAYCSITWQNSNTSRGERLVWTFMEVFPVLILTSFWGNMENTGRISHVVAGQLILYSILALMINRLVSVGFEQWMIASVKDGTISTKIIKPMSLQLYLIANELMWRTTGIFLLLPVIILFLPRLVTIQGISAQPSAVGLGIILALFSFFLRFFISWLIVLMSFWMDQANSLVHFRWMAEGFFGGQWLPLFFFPSIVRQIASWTPFYTWYFVPIQLMTGTMSTQEGLTYAWRALGWFFVLFFLGQVMWRKAIQKYSAVGG
ncbi:MAG: ABC-2 family transporter protein [Patescibacteria group bacterium]